KVVHTYQFGHKEPHGLVLVPGTNQMLVTNRGSANISVIDLTTNKELATIAVAPRPDIIAISPDGKEAYVTSREDKSLQIVDIPRRKVVANIKLGGDPHGVAFRP
ncbi:MAG: YncE family protein, partial [Acidobacteriota bacterium]